MVRHRFGLRRSCETWIGDVKVLSCFFGSFSLSGDTFGPHFGRLGVLVGLILGLLGLSWSLWESLFGLSWPKLAQDSEKTRFFEFDFRKLAQVGSQKSRKIDVKNDVFFTCVFNIDLYRFFIDLGLQISMFFERFLNIKRKRRFCKK